MAFTVPDALYFNVDVKSCFFILIWYYWLCIFSVDMIQSWIHIFMQLTLMSDIDSITWK